MVPKEIGQKAERYQKLREEGDSIFAEIEKYLEENADAVDVCITALAVVDKSEARGEPRNADDFDDRVVDLAGGSGYGIYYLPIEGTNKCLRYNYVFG